MAHAKKKSLNTPIKWIVGSTFCQQTLHIIIIIIKNSNNYH